MEGEGAHRGVHRRMERRNAAGPPRPLTPADRIRGRAILVAVAGSFLALFGALFALALDAKRFVPLAIAAAVATASVALRVVLSGIAASAHVRVRRRARHFTGERAAYVRTSQRLAMMDRDFTAADYEMLLDLDDNSQRLRRFLEGASQELIDRLPSYIYGATREKKVGEVDVKMFGTHGLVESSGKERSVEEKLRALHEADSDIQTDDGELQKIAMNPELGGDTARSCTICLEDFEAGMKIRVLPCFHRFMATCIDPWLLQQARCPVCKANIHGDLSSMPGVI